MGKINYKGERALFDNWTAPVEVSLSTTTARTSAALDEGNYLITCDEDCFFILGASDCEADSSDRRLWAKTYRRLDVPADTDKQYVAAILASGTATLSIEKVG